MNGQYKYQLTLYKHKGPVPRKIKGCWELLRMTQVTFWMAPVPKSDIFVNIFLYKENSLNILMGSVSERPYGFFGSQLYAKNCFFDVHR